ncbi:MAG: dihydroxyacetone kinase subunit DhaL [Eubacteriales bacterium]|nr:dihydroxyacetone kinase subunit DhaL [Eubacteriales bacterium]
MNLDDFYNFFSAAKQIFEENLNELCRLDSVLGDGDHGVSMLKGFKCIESDIQDRKYESISDLLFNAGKTMMKEIGGTCGPLFAAVFMQAGMAAKGKTEIGTEDLALIFRRASDAVMNLGKAKAGEKTMVDALLPAAESLEFSKTEGKNVREALTEAAEAAGRGAEATRNMLATKGRARYQGEKSIGAVDPGAMSVCFIFKALASV